MKRKLSLLLPLLLLVCLLGCNSRQFTPAVDGWTLISTQNLQIADGVNYTEIYFRDEQDLPHIAYVLTADPEKVTLHKGTSNNGLELMPAQPQNVLEHMAASAADGLDVVAAVNGDFFNIESTYMPVGLSVKNGTVLRENTSFRPFSAFTKDGNYLISDGKTDKTDYASLEMATGGSHILVRNDKLLDVYQEDDFSTTPHPRTLSGVRNDKTILFVVIDGRQPELSNGATLLQCGQLMQSLGAKHAINHDGGGSSTMIIRTEDKYTTVNSPSDGSLRDVFCSIQIVLK